VQGMQGLVPQAMAAAREALRLKPDLADAHNTLGVLCSKAGSLEDSAAAFRESIRLNPANAPAMWNLGAALTQLKRPGPAVGWLQRAVALKPDAPEANANLGVALVAAGYASVGVAHLRRAAELSPANAEIRNAYGTALAKAGDVDGALVQLEQALKLSPDFADARVHRALLWMLKGDFARGLPEYEWRWRSPQMVARQFPAPAWAGERRPGATILLHAEQGLGDALQFVRYAPLVRERTGTVIVEVPPAAARVIARCPGIDRVVRAGEPLPRCDVQAPLMSLPRIFGTTVTAVPPPRPPSLDPAHLAQAAAAIPPGGLRVGLAWQGSLVHAGDRYRSIPLEMFAPLSRVEGARLFSLQQGPGIEQLAAPTRKFTIEPLVTAEHDLLDTAALMSHLDLVICVDSALAHLAGLLGRPVWIPLPLAPDWRWLERRSDSPWYPGMRLYRQAMPLDWDDVIARMAGDLRALVR